MNFPPTLLRFSICKPLLLAAVFGWIGLPAAMACSVPVFRYALDRWDPEPYRLEVTSAQAEAWEEAVPRTDAQFALDVTASEGAVLKQPFADRWIPLDQAITPGGLGPWRNSPAREEIARRITAGDSAVFVVLHEGDPSEAVAAIEKRLRHLESILELPELDPNDPADDLGPGPDLKIAFSTLAIPRDSEKEQELIAMLTTFLGEEDTGETVVIPVFGRGRALGILPIDEQLQTRLDEVALYLCGACSCQVKKLNPGWDLLIDFDWDTALESQGAARRVTTLEESEEAPAADPATDEKPTASR